MEQGVALLSPHEGLTKQGTVQHHSASVTASLVLQRVRTLHQALACALFFLPCVPARLAASSRVEEKVLKVETEPCALPNTVFLQSWFVLVSPDGHNSGQSNGNVCVVKCWKFTLRFLTMYIINAQKFNPAYELLCACTLLQITACPQKLIARVKLCERSWVQAGLGF